MDSLVVPNLKSRKRSRVVINSTDDMIPQRFAQANVDRERD